MARRAKGDAVMHPYSDKCRRQGHTQQWNNPLACASCAGLRGNPTFASQQKEEIRKLTIRAEIAEEAAADYLEEIDLLKSKIKKMYQSLWNIRRETDKVTEDQQS